MNWVLYAVIAAFALAAADVLVKVAAGKIPNSLGMLLYGVVPFAIGLVWFLLDLRERSLPRIPPAAAAAAFGVGLTFTLVTFALYAAFKQGAPLSIASPLIRLGGLIVAAILGLLVWKEPLSLRYLCGLALACSGIYLIISK